MATLRQLQTFIAVAEHRKMSEAAKHLYISQPTVSQIISDLEKEYETQLFDRLNKELRITSSGKILLASARQIVAIYENLEQSMKHMNACRPLRVGGTMTIGNTMMADIILELTNKFPDIDVSVVIDNTEHIEHLLMHNELDIAIVEGIIRREEIITKPALEDRLCLICGPEHPFAKKDSIELKDLYNQDFIMREKGSGTRAIFENMMMSHRIPFKVKWESSSSIAIINAVRKNLGLAFLSARCISEYTKNGELYTCPLTEISMKRFFYLCHNRCHPITSQMQDFSDLIHSLNNY